jgi:hypothetical protein
MSRKKWIDPPKPDASDDDRKRFDYVMDAAQKLFEFYQNQVVVNFWWHTILTVVTLLGTAATPLFALLLYASPDPRAKFWIALPSGIAGVAAAASVAFRFKDEWAQNFFTLSAIDIERDRFQVRASPEYSVDKSLPEVIANFQNRLGQLVMSEVTTWRQETIRSSVHHEKLGK